MKSDRSLFGDRMVLYNLGLNKSMKITNQHPTKGWVINVSLL